MRGVAGVASAVGACGFKNGVGQSAAPSTQPPMGLAGGTAVPLMMFALGGIAILGGIAYAKEKLK